MVFFSFDEHVFSHPWEKVVEAALRKYPNPESPNVTGTDVFERKVDEKGRLCSQRIISSLWSNSYLNLIEKVAGLDMKKTFHAIEYSVLDPKERSFELSSRNYNFMDYITVDEKLVYQPHATDPNMTVLKQQWHITCKNLSFVSFFENAMGTTMMAASVKGRQGIEYVINQVREEVERIASAPIEEMQTLATNTMKEINSFQQSIGGMGRRWEENLHEELNEFIAKSGSNLIEQPQN
nr:PRELI domain containing protein 3A-like [Ciona intestinalis]|eukprot:XP_002124797.3 PRELI domain containing protein 3A-like [Ciona intestinalis]